MQYFLGYPSFCDVAPFDASLFVEFRKRLGKEQLQQINALIVKLGQQKLEEAQKSKEKVIPMKMGITTTIREVMNQNTRRIPLRLILSRRIFP